ncbi:hypothetical protein A2U01_0055948, partial [Trifolium medium]|nr:hypothetical protein [Trifolium medium]
HLATDVKIFNTLCRAQRYWAWGADINGGWLDQKPDSRRLNGSWMML